ncbi:MAG: 2,3-bisphosphoglycerate-independent phosphoglycerate mutase [Chloroflexi bacterium]|nr:2,3-bisphosphoglycerate-independent phosphoglycerate mutase [Chloroflexota bacterium]MCL5075865.1 2,3-bisphosphoglycerate-independent phosphoglycerate mutase [Chloroflexota bacterium]
MIPSEILQQIVVKTPSKIVLFVIDGLGGLPHSETGKTELETARTPNLDHLAALSLCGSSVPISLGITPGSGPAHLALFGYDPIQYDIGRGVLSALGVGFPLEPSDVAARINFATVDENGLVTDRRAGRISSEVNRELCALLRRKIQIADVQLFLETERGHRAAVIFRGDGLSDKLTDSDPQLTGVPPLEVQPLSPEGRKTATIVNEFIAAARAALKNHHPANAVLLRGFAKRPSLPLFSERYKLSAAAIATYPMYKGLARLVGIEVLPCGDTLAEEIKTLQDNFAKYDFFYVHVKAADTAGEDGDFERKVRVLEEIDSYIPALLELKPDVLVVTGDHSTPSALRGHSWHAVPFLLYSRWALPDGVVEFGERALLNGGLGRFLAVEAMPLMLAHALKLIKYGA